MSAPRLRHRITATFDLAGACLGESLDSVHQHTFELGRHLEHLGDGVGVPLTETSEQTHGAPSSAVEGDACMPVDPELKRLREGSSPIHDADATIGRAVLEHGVVVDDDCFVATEGSVASNALGSDSLATSSSHGANLPDNGEGEAR